MPPVLNGCLLVDLTMPRLMPVPWQVVLAVGVMTLAAFNLTFRIGQERLLEWDSALYATSALEMLTSDRWAATTFNGTLDYYNSKPPLNVWLIALSMKTFGISLGALRVASVTTAWLTIVVLLVWAWRRFSPQVGLLSALVLTTCFAFLYVHSGRSANPDAPLALCLLLILVTLDASLAGPWRRVWLGPLLAGVFMLKGMAVIMPLVLIAVVEIRRSWSGVRRWAPLATGALAGGLPVAAWAVAR